MSQSVPYWHVDAFAAQPFTGNQAAVMIFDEWPADDVLVAIGAENNFAETAFLVRNSGGEADWELRWCTPTYEIALCGHATLASGHVVLDPANGLAGESDVVRFRTRKSGILQVRRADNGYEVALPAIMTEPRPYPEAVALLGAEPQEVWLSEQRYGIYLYDSAEEVLALDPDLRALGALGKDQFICTAPGRDTDVVSRVFVPGGGVDEDSVTGSAHAALAPFWAKRLGRNGFSAYQASRRGGHVACRLAGDSVWLGGECVIVVEGRFTLPG